MATTLSAYMLAFHVLYACFMCCLFKKK